MEEEHSLLFVSTPTRLASETQVSPESESDLESDFGSVFELLEIMATVAELETELDAAFADLETALAGDNDGEKTAAREKIKELQVQITEAKLEKLKAENANLKKDVVAQATSAARASQDLLTEKIRSRKLEEDIVALQTGARPRRTLLNLSAIQEDGATAAAGTRSDRRSVPPVASSTTVPAPAAPTATATTTSAGTNFTTVSAALAASQAAADAVVATDMAYEQRLALMPGDQRLIAGDQTAVYDELSRYQGSLTGYDAQHVILSQRPNLFGDPTPDHIYALVHRTQDAPETVDTHKEDLRQEKSMMQKLLTQYDHFSGSDTSKVTWEMFEMQMDGIKMKGMYKEREMSIVLWGLLEGDARLTLMSKGVFQGDDYSKMLDTLKQEYQRDFTDVLQDMASCMQGQSESVRSFTARYRLLSHGTFPKPPPEYRVVNGKLVPNPLSLAEDTQYKKAYQTASLNAQHHYLNGLRHDIRHRMRTLQFSSMQEAEEEAKRAEKDLKRLGALKTSPNPLGKPQINMLSGHNGHNRHRKGQSQGQGQTTKFDGECYICHKQGHMARNCRSNSQTRQHSSRSQQDENAHVQGAMNAVKGQVSRSSSAGSRTSHRGRSPSPRGRSPHARKSGSGSSSSSNYKKQRQGRGGSRNRDQVSFSNNSRSQRSSSGSQRRHQQRRGKFNALHGEEHEQYESGNE